MCIVRDFLRSPTENKHIPFPTLVTNLVETVGIRGSGKKKRVLPRMRPITNKTEAKIRAASTRPQSSHPPPAISGVSDSCAVGYAGINKIYNLTPPIVVALLLQYSGSRVEHRDRFSSHK